MVGVDSIIPYVFSVLQTNFKLLDVVMLGIFFYSFSFEFSSF